MGRLTRAAGILLWTLPGIVNAAAAQSTPPHPATNQPAGTARIQAVRLKDPLHIDGHLDEEVYTTVAPISDFIQMEPRAGEAATEKTEVWVFFDQHNVYVAMRAWESRPDLMVANEMRRDSNNICMGDCVGFSLDTFHDGRNAYQFEVNPLGARTDGQSTNERQYSSDWNTVQHRFRAGRSRRAAGEPDALQSVFPGEARVQHLKARVTPAWLARTLNRGPALLRSGRTGTRHQLQHVSSRSRMRGRGRLALRQRDHPAVSTRAAAPRVLC